MRNWRNWRIWRRKRFWIPVGILMVVLLVLLVWKNAILQAMADHLVSVDEPARADVIIVLGGEREGERTEKAAQLREQGYADRLMLTDGLKVSWRHTAVGEMKAYALQRGVPEESIWIEDRARSTYENALYTREIMEAEGWDEALVVTTDWHTQRSRYIFEKVYEGSGIELRYIGAEDPRFPELELWWADGEKQQVVLEEWAKYLVYLLKY